MTLAKNPVVEAFVKVALEPTRFWRLVFPRTVKVLVTVVEAETRPPNKETVDVAVAPRAVTVANVSLSANKYAGQLVPVDKQTVRPFTKSEVVETTPEAKRFVVETLVEVASLKEMFCKEEELLTISVPAVKPPKLAVVPKIFVLDTTAEAKRFVVVTDVPVATVHVTP